MNGSTEAAALVTVLCLGCESSLTLRAFHRYNCRRVVPMKLVVTLDRDETGMIVVECPSIPGCISQGKTEAEALANIREAIQACMEARAASGMPLTVATREVEVAV